MRFFTVILPALALAVLTTSATPIDSDDDEGPFIGPPEVLEPGAGNTWVVGTQQLVGWGAAVEADLIEDPTLYTGTIVLGFKDGKTSSENLDTSKPPPHAQSPRLCSPWWPENPLCMRPPHAENPLAQGVNLSDGEVSITVPNKPDGTTYFVVRESPSWGVGTMP